jgi:hypothetical protein
MQRARQGGWPDHQDSRDNGSTAASEQLTFGLFLQSLELHKSLRKPVLQLGVPTFAYCRGSFMVQTSGSN